MHCTLSQKRSEHQNNSRHDSVTAALQEGREEIDSILAESMPKSTPVCLACKEKPCRVRGLCELCLIKCIKAICARRTNWCELEQIGLAVPLDPSRWSPGSPKTLYGAGLEYPTE
jgi:hypothetical protein